MYQVISRKDEINLVASRLNGTTDGVFAQASLANPRFVPAELGFLRTVSWLFVLFNEVGKIGTLFLVERLGAYQLDGDGQLAAYLNLIAELRTYLQHSLNASRPRDKLLQERCEGWLRTQCGTPIPSTEEQWNRCLLALLGHAVALIEALLEAARRIEGDESRDAIVAAWVSRITRYHPPHVFDGLIARVATDMGRDKIEPVELRKRFYQKWTDELRALEDGYDFEIEGRKLIEHALLNATVPTLPITGADILEVFGIAPGPDVGRWLAKARQLYDAQPCSKDVLLQRLRDDPIT